MGVEQQYGWSSIFHIIYLIYGSLKHKRIPSIFLTWCYGAEKIIIDTCQNTHINLLFIFNKVKTKSQKILIRFKQSRISSIFDSIFIKSIYQLLLVKERVLEIPKNRLFYAELELTNPSRVDILPEPYPTNLVPVPSLIAAMHQRCKDFFRENLPQIISALF